MRTTTPFNYDKHKLKGVLCYNAITKNHKDYFIMALSSINLQPSTANAFLHNDRKHSPDYIFKDKSYLNEFDLTAEQAQEKYQKLLKEATKNYTERTGQKIQTDPKRFRWSAVVNLNAEHTLKDVKKLADELSKRYGWQPLQIAVHKDEGKKGENGELERANYHAHIEFLMLDKNGIYAFKKRDFNTKKMSEIQDLTAEILGMERGLNYYKENKGKSQDEKILKPKRLNHHQQRHKAQEIERIVELVLSDNGLEKATSKDLKALNMAIVEKMKEAKAKRKDYAEWEQTKKELNEKIKAQELTIQELERINKERLKLIDELKKSNSQNIDPAKPTEPTPNLQELEQKYQKREKTGLFSSEVTADYKAIAQEQDKIIKSKNQQLEYEARHRDKIIQQELSDERGKFEAEKQEFNAERDTIYNYKRTITSLEQRNERLQSEKDDLHTANFRLRKSNEELKKQNDDNLLALNALEAQIKAEKEKNKELQAQKDKIDLNANLSVLEPNPINELKKELESIQKMPKVADILEPVQEFNTDEALKALNFTISDKTASSIRKIEIMNPDAKEKQIKKAYESLESDKTILKTLQKIRDFIDNKISKLSKQIERNTKSLSSYLNLDKSIKKHKGR